MTNTRMNSPDVVLLVHGSRTHANWYPSLRRVLKANGFIVSLSNYGKFDLFRFLLPIGFFRRQTQRNLYRQIRATQQKYPNSRISIIAHSFGTYLIANILRSEFDLRLGRIIFVGSVVRYDFPLEHCCERFEGDILNEVGTLDPWPAMAESSTTGYGYTGTYGFKREYVFDAWNNTTHSELLTVKNCTEKWIPFLIKGTLPPESSPSNVPWWIRLISTVKIKYIITVVFAVYVIMSAMSAAFRSEEIYLSMYPGQTGWTLSDNDWAKTINEELGDRCKLEQYFGIDCHGCISRYLTQRDWRTVVFYDSKLDNITFPKEFEIRTRNPLEFWKKLSEEYSNCIDVRDDGRRLELHYREECDTTVHNQEIGK